MGLTDYNTIKPDCAESCSLARICMPHGMLPEAVVKRACDAADVRYGGCSSENGPDLLPSGRERCGLSSEAQQAVLAFASGMEAMAQIQEATPPVTVPALQLNGYMR